MAMETLFGRCQRIVRDLMQKNGWQLLREAIFVNQVFAQIEEGSRKASDASIRGVAKRVYCKLWHDSCSAPNVLYWRAYEEATNYFYKLARKDKFVEDDAAEIALLGENRLIKSFKSEVPSCELPEFFTTFLYNNYRAVKAEFLRERKREEPLEGKMERFKSPKDDMDKDVICEKLRSELLLRLEELVQEKPGSHNQLLAFIMKWFFGKSDMDIAQELGVSLKSIPGLRARGKQKLENDDALQELFKALKEDCW